MRSQEAKVGKDSGVREVKKPECLKGKGGFVAGGGIFFILWLMTYGITGLLVGKTLGHLLLGAGLGVLVGICPSALISVGAHYGSFLSFLPLVYLISFMFLPQDVRMIAGIGLCVLPAVMAIPLGIRWISSRSKKARVKEVLRRTSSEEIRGYLTSGSSFELAAVILECGRRGEALFVPALGHVLLRHASELDGVRAEAARALLSIDSTEAREILKSAVEAEEKKSVRNGTVIDIIRKGLPA
ncbi:MAG: HEAT repeat domain-containing protein [Deltaproteobacteria bacterium]|nr:HEAT repeat domain-containing protein [Deltaproteobacteria bacterium]